MWRQKSQNTRRQSQWGPEFLYNALAGRKYRWYKMSLKTLYYVRMVRDISAVLCISVWHSTR